MNILQPLLFPQKEDFSPENFQKKCLTPEFIICLQKGASEAMHRLNDVLKEPLCTRNKSSLLHEYIARSVKEQIESNMTGHDVICYIDPAGNKRDVISYSGYTFIFRKNLKQRNDSVIADQIDSQELESHVVTINYATDPFWASIISLNLLYIESNTTLHSFPIGVSQDKPVFEIDIPSKPQVEKIKPSINKDKAKRKKELA